MKTFTGLIFITVISCALGLIGIQDAEARRFGGARSFGGKSSYRTPYRKSTTNSTRSASQQKAHQQNQSARQNLTRRGGLMGMLGGLALGGLLGSMFFGGAFENINFFDILILGGIAYFLMRLFAAKSQRTEDRSHQHPAFRSSNHSSNFNNDRANHLGQSSAGFDTDILSNKSGVDRFKVADNNIDADFAENNIPDDFNEKAFLKGAKSAFIRLQAAWDDRDLTEIRELSTDKVFTEIQEQLSADNGENKTDVLKVDAELLEIRNSGAELEAVVMFDCIIREDTEARPEQIREVWHFIKSVNSTELTWFLDGIQQLEG